MLEFSKPSRQPGEQVHLPRSLVQLPAQVTNFPFSCLLIAYGTFPSFLGFSLPPPSLLFFLPSVQIKKNYL